MKTALDAAIECKGDVSNVPVNGVQSEHVMLLCTRDNDVGKISFMGGSSIGFNRAYYLQACTYKEFNALVDELASNFGKCDISYQKHCSNEVARLEGNRMKTVTREGKVYQKPCSNEIAWLEGDEMKTSKYTYIGKSSKYFTHGECYDIPEAECNTYTTKDDMGGGHVLSESYLSDNFVLFTSNPVYTQEMHEAGELPSVGAKFKVVEVEVNSRIFDFKDKEVEVIGLCKDGESDIITFSHPTMGVDCRTYNRCWIEPLEPPVRLVDGECYQFDGYTGGTCKGVYDKSEGCFWVKGQPVQVDYRTNIQPLTVA